MRNARGQFIEGEYVGFGFASGHVPWNKGSAISEETRQKLRLAKLGKKNPKHSEWLKAHPINYWKGRNKPEFTGSGNPQWKGNEVGYRALHIWVESKLGKPSKCEHCNTDGLTQRKIHWANKSGQYLRDLDDWMRLCAKCHKQYDMTRAKQLRR